MRRDGSHSPVKASRSDAPFGSAPVDETDPKTQGEEAYRLLRQDILSGRLDPESKLRFRELCKHYGLGLAALREALSRLASERLVAFEPLRGYRVARLSLDELRDICALRIELSVQGLADAIDQGDSEWEAALLASLHRLVRTPLPKSLDDFAGIEDWERKHERFHTDLIAACGSPWRLHLCSTLSFQFERYRRHILMGMAASSEIAQRIDDDHTAIAMAAISRDKKEAVRLLQRHLRGGLQFFVERYPDAGSE